MSSPWLPKSPGLPGFNQANLFHASATGNANEVLVEELGEENLPRHVYFGNGDPIPTDTLAEINRVIESEKCIFPWEKSDILVIDNLLMDNLLKTICMFWHVSFFVKSFNSLINICIE